MATREAPHQTVSKLVGLAVFGADALSSIAYAPQETLVILAAAGPAAFGYAFPIALVITALLAIVTLSYQQTIHAYPNGGGAYTVARENLGVLPAQIAGAALLMDYILLAAVAISSGVAQIVSAFPALFAARVPLAVVLLVLIMVANLRGVKESGALFSLPTYFFLGMTTLTVAAGFWRYLAGSLGPVVDPPALELVHGAQPLTLFLLLRAFSNGTTALTGVECISNGVTAFQEPRTRNASQTILWMSAILGTLFVGITFLLGQIGAVPAETETVISQLARSVFGDRGLPYLGTIAATTVILVLAANTAFAGFPQLTAIIAAEGFLPRYFAHRGSRLVFTYGIVALTAIAGALIVAFNASVTALIPLWAVGVFLSFTLSQAGMARHWWRAGRTAAPDRGWAWKLAVNSLGALCTAVVTVVFAVTKFADGAWIILLLLPASVAAFFAIRRHYRHVTRDLSLDAFGQPPRTRRHRVVVPISGIHRGALSALDYARSLSSDVTVIHIASDPAESEEVRRLWNWWGDGARLVIIDSPYRAFLEPLLEYIDMLCAQRQDGERLTIVVPQFVPEHWWHGLLHAQTAFWLRFALLNKHGLVITEVPYQVDRDIQRPADGAGV
ncbi:MAG: APC family permease [Anaerolineales bacterium]|nr:APC family permease [Anaerolineales bacterium]